MSSFPLDGAPPEGERGLRTGDLDWRELRDALWLAVGLTGSPSLPERAGPPAPRRSELSPGAQREEDRSDSGDSDPRRAQRWSAGPSHEVRAVPATDDTVKAGPLVWPAAPALPNGRLISRALRPLARTTPSPWRTELDEEKTADRAAQDGLFVPEFRPVPWHGFELVIVLDTAGAMELWSQTVSELCELFRRQGAFRNVRTLLMSSAPMAADQVVFQTARSGGVVRRWRDEIDPTGRRLFLVLTDTMGDGWRSGAVTAVLGRLARRSPLAIVNLLPQRLWHWGALLPRRVKLSAAYPSVPNAQLRVESSNTDPSVVDGSAIPVPVLGLDPEWWSCWVRLFAKVGSGWVDTTAVFLGPDAPELAEPPETPVDLPPRDRVLRFRTVASVDAFRLAGLLAAAPLSLSTMDLVRRELLPGSDLSAIAEVLLGGLLRQVPVHGDPDVLEFRRGVRDELLSGGRRGDTVRVARLLAEHAGSSDPVLRNFRDALDDPDDTPEPEVSAGNRLQLQVQEAVFRALSGRYAPRAGRLRRKLELGAAPQPDDTPPVQPPTISATRDPESVRIDDRNDTVAVIETQPEQAGALPPTGGGEVTASSGPIHSADTGRSQARQPRIWGGVPLRNPDFVGREALLEQLRMRLIEPGGATAVLPEALHGMGGVGKSQTVVEYIYRHAIEYDIVWWIPAEHTTQIRNSFLELAKKLDVPSGMSAENAEQAVLEALRNGEPYPRWILVFDNAERPDVVRPYLPAGFGHVVVTSRNSEWAGVARTVEVDLFTRAESMELLRRRGGEIEDSEADKLAEALGDLPLAIEQAASWRAQTGMPVTEYLRLLDENSAELLKAGATGDYELPVAAAWNVPLSRLRTDRREALELLQVCAFFGPEPISRSLFTGVRGAPVPEALEGAFADPIRLNQAIREISRYSLAKIDHRNNTLQLHRLVQAVLRDQLDSQQQANMRHTVHLMLVNGDPDDPETATNWSRYASLLPHAVSALAIECQDKWVRRVVNNLVQYLLSAGDYHGALQLAEQAREARLRLLGEDHLDTLLMGRHHGEALRRVGRVTDAIEVNRDIYARMTRTLGDDHDATLDMSEAICFNYRVQGLLFKERDQSERTLERAKRVLSPEDPATLRYANNLAARYRLTGEYDKARALDEETLRRRTDVLGAEHEATLNTLSGLAMDLRELGLHLQACEMQEDTSARLMQLFGPDHPTTMGGSRCLAVSRRRAGQHEKAMELTEDCYNRYRLQHGETHVDTVTGLMDMSTELRHLGDLERSWNFGRRSVEQFEKVYNAEHPFTMIAATNLAVSERLLGNVDQARRLNERALAGLMDKVGADHPYTLVAAANLGSDMAELGELEPAYAADVDTLERCTRALGEDHPTTLAVAHNLSIDLNLLDRPEEAAILHTKTVTGFRRVLGGMHPATLAASQNVRANCDADTMQL